MCVCECVCVRVCVCVCACVCACILVYIRNGYYQRIVHAATLRKKLQREVSNPSKYTNAWPTSPSTDPITPGKEYQFLSY